jgi:hypothetical protein
MAILDKRPVWLAENATENILGVVSGFILLGLIISNLFGIF